MKKNLLCLLLGGLTSGALTLSAQTPAAPAAAAPAAPSASWTVTPSIASQYMFRGTRLGGPSFQPTVEYSDGSAFTAGVWGNVPISDKVVGQSDPEFDFYASYKIEAVKDTLTWQPGATLYAYPNAKKANGFYKTTFEPNVALVYTAAGWTLTPKVYYDFVLKGPTLEVSAAYTIPLKEVGTELGFTGTVGTFKWDSFAPDQGADLKNYGNYWLLGVAAPFQINKESKIVLGWAYTKGSDNYLKLGRTPKYVNTAAVGRGVVTVSYAYSF